MLKPLKSVLDADPRYANMVVGTVEAGVRFITLSDHHSHIAAIELEPYVPPHVLDVYERARNAYLYAWFVYELTPLAEQQGYAALELALRDRLGPPPPKQKRWQGLVQLFDHAAAAGYFDKLATSAGYTERGPYVESVRLLIGAFRNELAHGSGYLNIPGAALDKLRLCRDLINATCAP